MRTRWVCWVDAGGHVLFAPGMRTVCLLMAMPREWIAAAASQAVQAGDS